MPDIDPTNLDGDDAAKGLAAGLASRGGKRKPRVGWEDDEFEDAPDRTPGSRLFITVVVVIGVLVAMLALILATR